MRAPAGLRNALGLWTETVSRSCALFASAKDGAAAVIFGIALIPVVGLTGAAFDYSRANDIKSQYQDAADAAVLAAAASGLRTFGQRQDLARNVFNANAPQTGHQLVRVDLSEHNDEFTVRASGTVDTTLLEILGVRNVDIGVDASAVAAGQPLEVAFVIDATNSMLHGSRWQTAYDSLDAMLETLDDASRGRGELFVTVIPMGDTMNIGRARTDWVQGLVENPDPDQRWGGNHDYNYMREEDWVGCVFAREQPEGGNPYRLTDERPADAPFGVVDPTINSHAYPDRGNRTFRCPNPIIGPTMDVDYAMREVGRIRAAGTGRFDMGMAWGWRAVSANWQGVWGIPSYPAVTLDERRKVVVFITDGNSTMEQWRFDGHMDWGWNNAGREMLGNLVTVCSDARSQGIEVFTLYVRGNPHAESYMRDCASSPSHFFDVTRNNDMAAAFAAMGAGLVSARLVR